jgi:hypothetical protein
LMKDTNFFTPPLMNVTGFHTSFDQRDRVFTPPSVKEIEFHTSFDERHRLSHLLVSNFYRGTRYDFLSPLMKMSWYYLE